MGLFDVNYGNLVTQQIPVRLRNGVMMAWLKALVSPVVYLKGLFDTNRANNLYNLAHNGQVCYLQAALNDVFDDVSRRIYITDGQYDDPLFIYRAIELKPVWLGRVSEEGSTTYPDPEVLYTAAETYLLGVSFVVHVPSAVTFDMAHLRAVVDKYRLPGKGNYTVVTF